MARFIDADKLNFRGCEPIMDKDHITLIPLIYAESVVRTAPTADVKEVKHGKWNAHYNGSLKPIYRCSVCNERLIGYADPSKVPYCHCGAKMDGGNGK